MSVLTPGYLGINDAAEWAGISTRTLKRWIARGLPCYQAIPREKVLLKPVDIEQFLTKHQVPQPNLDALVGEVLEELRVNRI